MKSLLSAGSALAALALCLPLPTATPAAAESAVPSSQNAVPLISRAALFGNPTRSTPRISPDGRYIAYMAPRDGVMNIWFAPAGQPLDGRPLTASRNAPIRGYQWAANGTHIVYQQDNDGDENYRLYSVDVRSGENRSLTPASDSGPVRYDILSVPHKASDEIIISANDRDPRYPDAYSLNVVTGARKLIARNEGFGRIEISEDRSTIAALRALPDATSELVVSRDGKIEAIERFGTDDLRLSRLVGISHDGNTIFYLTSKGRNTAALFEIDRRTRRSRLLGGDDKADVTTVLSDPATGRPIAFSYEYQRPAWRPIGAAVGADLGFLQSRLTGNFTVQGRSLDNRFWSIEASNDRDPGSGYLFDRQTRQLTKLFDVRPELAGAPLAPLHSTVIRARDGLELVSYYALPLGSDRKSAGRPDRPLPMVLFVHGGPWNRDRFAWSPFIQLFTNRGYAVLNVNFRASVGFGKKLTNAGDGQWGKTMSDDLIDGVEWAIREGIADRDRIAILGPSYGGYATLVGMTRDADRFACGVSAYGPANLVTLLESLPQYWAAGLAQMYKSVGDLRTDEGIEKLTEVSPLHQAKQIRKPLLIAQGGNDVRVPPRESQQMVDAMKKNGVPALYLYFPDEGHAFSKPDNRSSFWAVTEHFLANCLGGRREPLDAGQLKRSTLHVPEGARMIDGLTEALGSPERLALPKP